MKFYFVMYDGGPVEVVNADSINLAYKAVLRVKKFPPYRIWAI